MSTTRVAFATDAGIGSAVGVVKQLLDADRTNRVLVFCGTQGEEHAEPLEELLALKDRHLDRLSLSFVMNREPDESELLSGALDASKIGALATKLFDAKAVSEYHVFGSPKLADDVTAALTKLGVDAARIRGAEKIPGAEKNGSSASAGASTVRAPAAGHGSEDAPSAANLSASSGTAKKTAAIPDATETRVEFVMDGRRRSFTMHRETESILDAAARANIDLPFSCKAGVCSTCRTKLLKGQVEMRENYALEDWELGQGFILACQSHAKTPEIELTYDEK